MAETEAGGLKFTFKADLTEIKNGLTEVRAQLAAMGQTARQSGQAVTAGMKTAERGVTDLSTKSSALTGLFSGVFSEAIRQIINFVSNIGNAIEKVRQLQDAARSLSISESDIGNLGKSASAFGIDPAKMNRELVSFGQKLREASVAGGELAEFMAKNNIAIRDAAGNMRPVQQVFADVARLVSSARNEFDKLNALAKLGFSSEMLRLFERGKDAVEEFGRAAITQQDSTNKELIRKYEELSVAWRKVMRSVQDWALEAAVNIAEKFGDMIHKVIASFSELSAKARAIFAEITGDAETALKFRNEATTVRNNEMMRQTYHDARDGKATYFGTLDGAPEEWKNLRASSLTINKKMGGDIKGLYDNKSSAAESLNLIERYIFQLQRARDMAQADYENWNKSNVERAKAVALADAQVRAQRDGVQLTEEQKQRIIELAGSMQGLRDKADQLRDSARGMSEVFGNALEDLIVRGNSAKNVMKSLLSSIASALIKGALLGQGMFASLGGPAGSGGVLGTIFSGLLGMRAGGGPVRGGTAYVVGERGPEVFVPGANGGVLSNDKAFGSSGSDNSSKSVNMTINLSGANGDATIRQIVAQGVQIGLSQFSSNVLPKRLDEIQLRGA